MSNARWTLSQGQAVIGQWRRSGQTLRAFAREHGWNLQRLYYWRARIEEAEQAVAERKPAAKFLPGVVVGLERPARVRVVLQCGVTVEAEGIESISPQWVVAVERGLGEQT